MGAVASLTSEDRIGLGIAAAAHVALLVALVLHDQPVPPPLPMPDQITVSLTDEVSLQSTAPDPAAAPQAAIAPVLSPDPAPQPLPDPAPPVPVRDPPPRPAERAPAPRASPAARASPRPTATQRARPEPQPSRPVERSGGSRIGADFLEGSSSGERIESRGTPAAAFGPAEQASLAQAINRQLKPHWSAPQGVDAELLVTVLSWELNEDGSLRGTPRVVSQSGISESNRPQAQLHAERAIRAVQLAAPFDLPPQFYDQWKRVRSWRFDRKL